MNGRNFLIRDTFSVLLNTITIQTFESLINTSLVAPGALAHRLQRRTACKMGSILV